MARFYGYKTQGSVTYDNRLNTMSPRKKLINEAHSLTERICLAGMRRRISSQTKPAHLPTKQTVTITLRWKYKENTQILWNIMGCPLAKPYRRLGTTSSLFLDCRETKELTHQNSLKRDNFYHSTWQNAPKYLKIHFQRCEKSTFTK
jgi:hypothetical protein